MFKYLLTAAVAAIALTTSVTEAKAQYIIRNGYAVPYSTGYATPYYNGYSTPYYSNYYPSTSGVSTSNGLEQVALNYLTNNGGYSNGSYSGANGGLVQAGLNAVLGNNGYNSYSSNYGGYNGYSNYGYPSSGYSTYSSPVYQGNSYNNTRYGNRGGMGRRLFR